MDNNDGCQKTFAEALNKLLGIIVSESDSDIDIVLSRGLRSIADAVNVDQIVVYRLMGNGHEKHFGQVYRWAKEDGGTTAVIEELRVVSEHPAIAKWIDICVSGACVNIHTGNSSDAEKAFLTRYGAKSLLLSPVLTKGDLWGAVAFQDHTDERYFDDLTVEFLSSSAHICANAFIIDETARALKRSYALANALNKMSETILTQSGKTFEDLMSMCGFMLADLAEIERFEILRNTTEDGDLYMSQIYRWEKSAGGTTKVNDKFVHVAYKQVAPVWERMFWEGRSLNGPIRLMPKSEAAVLESIGAKSAFLAPIQINAAPWGFVLFEDHKKERVFDGDLAEAMQSAAFLFASAVIRVELEGQLASEREAILKAEQTQVLIDATPLSCILIDKEANILTCNKSAVEFFKLSKKDDIQRLFDDLVPEYQPDGSNSKEVATAAVKKAYDNGHAFLADWTHRNLDGELLPCEATFVRVEYGGGYVVAAYIRDMRAVKTAAKLVTEKTALLAAIFSSTPDMIFCKDINLHYTECNKAMENYLNIRSSDIVGKGETNALNIPPQIVERLVAIDKKVIAEGRTITSEEVVKAFDGRMLPFEMVRSPLIQEGKITGLVGMGRDVTQRKVAEEELVNALEEAKNASFKAMKAYAETESALEAKSRFIANMNHEMRTPMNVIVGLTDLLLEDEISGKTKETLQKINIAGTTLMGLINDVLDISKVEAGKMSLTPVQYHVASMLNDIIALNTIRAEDKPVVFKLDINEDVPASLFGDDLRVKQILNNLLSNAFKYTKGGSVTLGMDCQWDGHSHDYIWVSFYVSDTGMGIRKQDVEKLFTDYNQVDTRANRSIEGTGLGLSITKKLVDLMDGEISVESEYGKGSTFRVRIRQGFVAGKSIGKETVESLSSFRYSDEMRLARKKLVRADLSYARVLVVDDFPTNLDVAEGMLRKYKMQVDCVMSGQESLDLIAAGEPVYDAIFMDHMMPGMDGVEAVKAIRALDGEYAQNIPIIALTANAVAESEKMFLENGFNAFLPKPFSIMSLDAVVQRWVRDKGREQ